MDTINSFHSYFCWDSCLFKTNLLLLFMKQYYLFSMVKMNGFVSILLAFPLLAGKTAETTITCAYKKSKGSIVKNKIQTECNRE